MQSVLESIFGVQNHVGVGQECARVVLMFLYGLIMVRLSGPRSFAKWSALDIVISIMAGSTMSRAITGNAPLPGTLAAVTVLFLLHWAFAEGSSLSQAFSRLIEGRPIILVREGRLDEGMRKRCAISLTDIDEAIREKELKGMEELANVERLILEPGGKLSVLKKVGPQKLAEKALA